MQTDWTAPKKTARWHLGLSFALPLLLAAPAAWSLWWASETVPGNAVVSERADPAPSVVPLIDAPDVGRVVAPNILDEPPRGLVPPARVLEALRRTPDESVTPPVPAPPPAPQPLADPRPLISVPGLKRDDALVVVEDLINASPLPAIEESDDIDDPTDALSPTPTPLGW